MSASSPHMKIVSTLFCSLAAGLCVATALAQAPSTNAPRPRPAPPAGTPATNAGTNAVTQPARNRLPFQGTVKSIDATAKTLTLVGARDQDRVIQLDGESRLIKEAKPVTLAEVVANDYARGLLKKNDRGEDVLVHGTFGPKPAPRPKSPVRTNKPITTVKPTGAPAQPRPAAPPTAAPQPQ
jgi:hypothetical protein